MSVQGTPDESVAYGVLTQMLIEHQQLRPRGAFILCPQLRLLWNPVDRQDRRANLPDIGIGRLMPNGIKLLQGGAEQKAAIIPLMATLPLPSDIIDNTDVRHKVGLAALQAADQVKAAVKNGAVPDDQSIEWIVAIGPYFIVRSFGPFSEAELDTRGHRPNPSGDAIIAELLRVAHDTASITPIPEPLYLIGTSAAADVLETFLDNGNMLYDI